MVKSTPALSEAARTLVETAVRLWTDPVEEGFDKIKTQDNPPVMSGHDFLVKLVDVYFEKNSLTEPPKDLSFLRDPDNSNMIDPRVTAFVGAHPEKLANLLKYCETQVRVGQQAASLDKLSRNPELSSAILKAVDEVEGEVSDVDKIVNNALKVHKPHGRGMAAAISAIHQLGSFSHGNVQRATQAVIHNIPGTHDNKGTGIGKR